MPETSQQRRADGSLVSAILSHKLGRLVDLSADDMAFIRERVLRPRELPAGIAVPIQGRALSAVVVTGWIGRLRLFADGRRQVVSTMLAGELVRQNPNPFFATATVALTDAQVADLTPLTEALEREPDRYPNLRRALTLASKLEEVQLAEQVVRLGRRSAFERLAHWLLDIQQRLSLAGLCDSEQFQMPLTQEVLSDILGLSIVHVNRTVKLLRTERLVSFRGGTITILDPERLRMLTEFTPLPAAEQRSNGRPLRSACW